MYDTRELHDGRLEGTHITQANLWGYRTKDNKLVRINFQFDDIGRSHDERRPSGHTR